MYKITEDEMRRVIFNIIVSLFAISSFGQTSFKGIVKDSITKESISFVHVIYEEDATLSDEEGNFTLPEMEIIIHFSAIGYEEKRIEISTKDSVVWLNPIKYVLPTIKVTPKKTTLVEIGTKKKRRVRHTFFSQGEGYQVVKFIPNKKHISGIVKTIYIYLDGKTKHPQKIRILLLAVDSFELKPTDLLIPKSKIIELGRKKGWIPIDISDLHLTFPENGFFAGVEFLESPQKIDIKEQLHIGLFPYEKDALTWIKFLGSEWNIPPFLNHQKDGQLNLMVKVKVDQFMK